MKSGFYSNEHKIKIKQSYQMNLRLSREMYETPESAVEELIQNSIDADASEIRITLNGNSILFEDNGAGFDKERVYAFCEQATDYKKLHKISSKGRKMKGSKGIGRYALFKLGEICEVITRTKYHPLNLGTIWRMDLEEFVVGNELKIKPSVWQKDKPSGTIFLLTNLTKDGILLKKRIEELKVKIAMNWDLDECSIYINDEKLKQEDIRYESGFFKEYDRRIEGMYVSGKLGLMTKEGNISGVTIKVKKRGVGSPSFFGVEENVKYNLFLNRLRGILFIDSLDDIINTSRSGFITTEKKYEIVANFINQEIQNILEKKLKQQDKIKKTKIDRVLKEFFKDMNNMLKKIFDSSKGVFKDLNKGDISEGEEELPKLEQGDERRRLYGDGKLLQKNNSLDMDGTINVDLKKLGKLKIGNYYWLIDKKSLGSGEKLIVIDENKRKIILNEDHPFFRIISLPKNLNFLMLEIIYSVGLTDEEFTNGELRNAIDNTMRKLVEKIKGI